MATDPSTPRLSLDEMKCVVIALELKLASLERAARAASSPAVSEAYKSEAACFYKILADFRKFVF